MGCLRGQSRDDLDDLGFGASENRTWLFRANATGTQPSPCPVNDVDLLQHNEPSPLERRSRKRKEHGTKGKKKTCICTLPRVPLSQFRLPSTYPSSTQPLSLSSSPFALFKSLRTRTSTPFLWISPDPIFTLFPLPFPTSARWRNHEEMSNLPTVRI